MLGGMLTGSEILKQHEKGRLVIREFKEENLNPNSYNLHIGSSVVMYGNVTVIDLKDKNSFKVTETYRLDDGGMILRPGHLYLVPTEEYVATDSFIPLLTGRSSIGRLGITIHQEAGFGDVGYRGIWTMQVRVTYPTKIYPHMPVAQVYFITPYGNVDRQYCGKYQDSKDPLSSKWLQ